MAAGEFYGGAEVGSARVWVGVSPGTFLGEPLAVRDGTTTRATGPGGSRRRSTCGELQECWRSATRWPLAWRQSRLRVAF
jgi:hypothetical protein